MTRKEFKERWERDDDGGGITFEEVAECAKSWGIASTPKIRPMDAVLYKVLVAANVCDAEDFNPEQEATDGEKDD